MDSADSLLPCGWRDVPEGLTVVWRVIFDRSSEGLDLDSTCPVCGARTLHRWFHLATPKPVVTAGRRWLGRGGEWQWCSTCKSFEHSSGLVPDWWKDPLRVDATQLMSDPDVIEEARKLARSE